MKDLPFKTRKFLDDAISGMPKTPFHGAKAISNFIEQNYCYGCDENISEKRFARYPDEVKKYMTCQESGIFNFLLAKRMGLDTILVEFSDYDGLNQSHLAALIRGSKRDYLIHNSSFDIIKSLESKKYVCEDGDECKFSSMILYDVPEVCKLVEDFNSKNSVVEFFKNGQTLSSYYNVNKKYQTLFYEITRHLFIEDDFLKLRKTYSLPGYHLNFLLDDVERLIFSSGINNRHLINPVEIGFLKEGFKYNENIHEEILNKISKAMLKTNISCWMVDEEFTKKDLDKAIALMNKPITKKQRKLGGFYNLSCVVRNKITDENLEKDIQEHNKSLEFPKEILFNQFYQFGSADNYNYYGKKQRNLLDKLKVICDDVSLKYRF